MFSCLYLFLINTQVTAIKSCHWFLINRLISRDMQVRTCNPDDSELLHGLERLRDIFHGKIEHSWLCREPTVWKWGHMTLTYWPFKATKFDWNVRIWRLVNEILGQSNLLWSSWQLLFLVPPLQPHYPNRNHGAGGAQVALKTRNPPGFSMLKTVNLLLW